MHRSTFAATPVTERSSNSTRVPEPPTCPLERSFNCPLRSGSRQERLKLGKVVLERIPSDKNGSIISRNLLLLIPLYQHLQRLPAWNSLASHYFLLAGHRLQRNIRGRQRSVKPEEY